MKEVIQKHLLNDEFIDMKSSSPKHITLLLKGEYGLFHKYIYRPKINLLRSKGNLLKLKRTLQRLGKTTCAAFLETEGDI